MDYVVDAKPVIKLVPLVLLDNVNSSDGKLALNHSNISNVLEPVATKPLMTISIHGPNSSDKVTVFNGLTNTLQNLEHGSEHIDLGILSENEVNIGPESKPGIYSTNQTFQVSFGNGENKKEIAILPLYVQPSVEQDWSTNDSLTASLVGLALLISSTTIFNIHKRLKEQTLTAIANYLKYAVQGLPTSRGIHRKKKTTKTFPKAVFLIRDWNFPSEFAYGLSGGLQFIQQEKLKTKDSHTRTSWQNRQIVNGLYQEIIGCLLPFSGKNIGEETDSCNPEFSKYLKQLIGNILDFQVDLRNLPTGKSVMSLLEKYARQPTDTQTNSMHIIRRFGIPVQLSDGAIQEYVKEALEVYEKFWTKFEKDKAFLNEKILKDIHGKAQKKAVDYFEQQIFPENEDDLDEEEDDDENSGISEFYETGRKLVFEALKKQFSIKKEKNSETKTAYLETLNANLLQQYANLMKPNMTGNNSDIFAKRQSKECIAGIREEYLEKIGVDGDMDRMMEDEEQNMNKLMSLLAEEENRILSRIGHQQTNKNDSTAR